jgi:hypothetical protein
MQLQLSATRIQNKINNAICIVQCTPHTHTYTHTTRDAYVESSICYERCANISPKAYAVSIDSTEANYAIEFPYTNNERSIALKRPTY